MSDLAAQSSFNTGEWAPSLYARVDLAKYRSGAALLENFFVDYRGGASTRPGTKYILQCYKSSTAVRLISMQVTFTTGYVLEFGDRYIRFFIAGAPVLETAVAITGASKANPCILIIPGNTYNPGDWIFIAGVVGMTQLNGNYYSITAVSGSNITIADLNGVAINSTAYTTYVSGGTASRVYTITSPYAAADLALLKFAQNVTELVLCHPKYTPYVLSIITATNWTLLPIVFGSTATSPPGVTLSTTLSAGSVGYSYVVTSVDGSGQESTPSIPSSIINLQDMRSFPGSIEISWTASPGAVAYNVYKCNVSYFGAPTPGSTFGFIGTATGFTALIDTNIVPDFSQTPPVGKNPFTGQGVASVSMVSLGTYTSVPVVSFSGASTIPASAAAVLQASPFSITTPGHGYAIGDSVNLGNGVVLIVASIGGGGSINGVQNVLFPGSNPGAITSGNTPANPVAVVSTSGAGVGAAITLTWGVGLVNVLTTGAGYAAAPTVVFSSGAAVATANLAPSTSGYPSVPSFFQQRLVLAAPTGAPQTFFMSQPGEYFNFNITDPSQATDSITGTLVSGQLNTIKSMISQTTGLLMLTDKASWLITGGSNGSAVSPSALVANAQSFNGASDVPPIVSNFDVLYVQSKGSIVRDSAYNIYANVFTGTDISVISSHLFYGYTINEWAWAEEPFKVVWGVRSDGAMLTLTFLKEQEFTAWSHSITNNGAFKSVAVVTEATNSAGEVDAIYTVVQRFINGNLIQYIERIAERTFTHGVVDAWTVDCAIQSTPLFVGSVLNQLLSISQTTLGPGSTFTFPSTAGFTSGNIGDVIYIGDGIAVVTAVVSGFILTCTITRAVTTLEPNIPTLNWQLWVPKSTFTGATFLAGQTVTGLADGVIIPPFTMPANGTFTLAAPASQVIVGLAFTAKLKTLALELGEPTVQGKVKKINNVDIRVTDTLGLSIGSDFNHLVSMKDLVLGNVSSMLTGQASQIITDLTTGDARTILDPTYTVPGQYCIQQSLPYPATILGVFPSITQGDQGGRAGG